MGEKDIKKEDLKKDNINIFDEFNADSELNKDVDILKDENEKDMFFYLNLYGRILQVLFFILLFIVIFSWIYVYIQKNTKLNSQSFLDPVCSVFLSDIPKPEANCSSIFYTESYYKEQLKNNKKKILDKMFLLVPLVYENNSFLKTKEVSFLLDKTENRLDILKVLENFDRLKSDFNGIEKKRLICTDFNINSIEKNLQVTCKTFSKGYEKSVLGFSGEKTDSMLRGTSISIANSFINYIEKNSNYFSLEERDRIFSLDKILGESGYTNETSFKLKLKINDNINN